MLDISPLLAPGQNPFTDKSHNQSTTYTLFGDIHPKLKFYCVADLHLNIIYEQLKFKWGDSIDAKKKEFEEDLLDIKHSVIKFCNSATEEQIEKEWFDNKVLKESLIEYHVKNKILNNTPFPESPEITCYDCFENKEKCRHLPKIMGKQPLFTPASKKRKTEFECENPLPSQRATKAKCEYVLK